MTPKIGCPHCGNADQTLIEKYLEPLSQIREEADAQRPHHGKKFYCQVCGKSWIVQSLPLEGPQE